MGKPRQKYTKKQKNLIGYTAKQTDLVINWGFPKVPTTLKIGNKEEE